MLRFLGGSFALLFSLSACATIASGPRLSDADVRRIADAEVRHNMQIDLRDYEISEPRYVPTEGYWSVVYYRKATKHAAFTVRISDKVQNASIHDSEGGVFEGAMNQNPDLH